MRFVTPIVHVSAVFWRIVPSFQNREPPVKTPYGILPVGSQRFQYPLIISPHERTVGKPHSFSFGRDCHKVRWDRLP